MGKKPSDEGELKDGKEVVDGVIQNGRSGCGSTGSSNEDAFLTVSQREDSTG